MAPRLIPVATTTEVPAEDKSLPGVQEVKTTDLNAAMAALKQPFGTPPADTPPPAAPVPPVVAPAAVAPPSDDPVNKLRGAARGAKKMGGRVPKLGDQVYYWEFANPVGQEGTSLRPVVGWLMDQHKDGRWSITIMKLGMVSKRHAAKYADKPTATCWTWFPED